MEKIKAYLTHPNTIYNGSFFEMEKPSSVRATVHDFNGFGFDEPRVKEVSFCKFKIKKVLSIFFLSVKGDEEYFEVGYFESPQEIFDKLGLELVEAPQKDVNPPQKPLTFWQKINSFFSK